MTVCTYIGMKYKMHILCSQPHICQLQYAAEEMVFLFQCLS